ncbi:MAG: AMP-binding protein, partial [Saccharolobus sp.]
MEESMIRGEKVDWEPRTQVEVLRESVNRFKDRYVIDYLGSKITYEELDRMSNSVAFQLSEYVKKGDIVIVSMQNIPQFIIVEYAIWKLGGVVLPINPSYTERELKYIVRDSNAKLMIASCESNTIDEIKVIRTNPNTFHEVS